jgi:hypothetical protein|tara:strand:+ start:282 stop:596 length:315 start_codon:yes stop_codon:yes gene_type:complete
MSKKRDMITAAVKKKRSTSKKKSTKKKGSSKSKAKPLNESTKKTLREKAKKSGKSYGTLVKVYRRGQGAFLSSGSRPGMSMAQWAMARVNSFIRGSKKHDTDLR